MTTRETDLVGAPPIPVAELEHATRRPTDRRAILRSFVVTFFAVVVLAAFLSPLLRTVTIALKTPSQISESNAPLWPALPGTFEYEGEELDVYLVPLPDGTTQELALLDAGRQESVFIDPPRAGRGAHHLAGLMARARAPLGVRAPLGELRSRRGRSSTSRGCCSTP